MKLNLETHNSYPVLSAAETMSLWMTSRYKLRAGMEIEYAYPSNELENDSDPQETIKNISEIFRKKHGIEIATTKGGKSKKVLKRELRDVKSGAVVQMEDAIESDGFMEHHIAPYIYQDGSVPVEVVMSPEILVVKDIAEKIKKIDDVVEEADQELIQSPLFRCGLHQTLTFEHMEHNFPDTVIANTVQIVRAYMAGLIYLSASGTLSQPTRDMQFRGFMRTVWQGMNYWNKYSLVFPRRRDTTGYWGIEFRYPDGTNSRALAGAVAVLNSAVVFKAISLSEFGVLKISEGAYRESKSLVQKFIAGSMENADWENIRAQAGEIINFVSDEITEIDPHGYHILQKVLEKPVFTLAKNEEEIKRPLYREFDRVLEEMHEQDEMSKILAKNMALDNSVGLDIREAKKRLARKVKVKYSDITALLDKHNIAWDEGLQKFAKVQKELFDL